MESTNSKINIICLESQAFHALIDEVINRIKAEQGGTIDRWIGDEEAMNILRISSKTTLQKYRDQGQIRFSQIGRKNILYDRYSIEEFIDNNAKDTF